MKGIAQKAYEHVGEEYGVEVHLDHNLKLEIVDFKLFYFSMIAK